MIRYLQILACSFYLLLGFAILIAWGPPFSALNGHPLALPGSGYWWRVAAASGLPITVLLLSAGIRQMSSRAYSFVLAGEVGLAFALLAGVYLEFHRPDTARWYAGAQVLLCVMGALANARASVRHMAATTAEV